MAMQRAGGVFICEDHPDFRTADDEAAAGHLRLMHADLWNSLQGVELIPNPNRAERRRAKLGRRCRKGTK